MPVCASTSNASIPIPFPRPDAYPLPYFNTLKLGKWLTVPDEWPSAAFQDAIATVLRHLWELARSPELDAPFRRFKAKVTPVEFVYIGALLYLMRQGYTMVEQSRAAFIVQRDIRKAHVDMRFNVRVAADCWRIIDAIENGKMDIEPPEDATSKLVGKRGRRAGAQRRVDWYRAAWAVGGA